MFTVTPIGSCRITTPLKQGQDKFGFGLNMSRCYGYCHSAAEAVQMAQFMLGQLDIPADIWPLVSRNWDLNEIAANTHEQSNLYVAEISSSKEVTIDGVSVQLNYLKASYPKFFADQKRTQAFWDLAEFGSQDEKKQFLADYWSGSPEQSTQSNMLARLTMRRATHNSLRKDLHTLKELLPNVMVVSHIDAFKPDGTKIASRSAFISDVEKAAEAVQLKSYNPTHLMGVFGQGDAIEDESAGLAHFTDQFGAAIMHDWMRTVIAPMTDQAVLEDKTSLKQLFIPQVFAAIENGHFADAQTRVQVLRDVSPAMAHFSTEFSDIQAESKATLQHSAGQALTTAIEKETALKLIEQADGHGLFDLALELAMRQPEGVNGLPRNVALSLVKRAMQAEQFDVAIDFHLPMLVKVDAITARLFAEACIKSATNIAHDLPHDQMQSVIQELDMATRIEFVNLLDCGFDRVITPTTTAAEALFAIEHCEASKGIRAAAAILSQWQSQQSKDTVTDEALLAILDDWVSTAVAQAETVDRIDALNAVLLAVPRHKTARQEMQAARQDLTVEIRDLGAAGDLSALLALTPAVAKLHAALPEFDMWIARVQFNQGDFTAAIHAGERAAQDLPAKINNWVLLMRAATKLGKDDKAVEFARNVVQLAANSNAKLHAEGQAILDETRVGG